MSVPNRKRSDHGGQQANRNGQLAEDAIAAILMLKRYIPQRQHLLYLGIFGTPITVDYFLPDVAAFPRGLVIESKWQESSGSIDEKFPYLVANIKTACPCPAIIVFGGGGFRPGAEAWLRRQIGGNLYGVYRLEEFLTWANHTL